MYSSFSWLNVMMYAVVLVNLHRMIHDQYNSICTFYCVSFIWDYKCTWFWENVRSVCIKTLRYFNTRGYKYLVQVKDSLIFSSPLLFNYVPWGAHTWFKIVNKLTELLKDHQMIIHLEFRAKYWKGFEKIATYPPDSYVKLPDWKSLEF